MNYIAHIHLAHCTDTSLLGNFLGDFVKGSDLSHLGSWIATGVSLHRKIDSYTDRHYIIQGLRERFPKHLRRMSGLVLDIYFDYLLCRHWQRFTGDELHKVLEHFYKDLAESPLALPGRYTAVKKGLLEHQWLTNYHCKETCLNAFLSIETRLSKPITFAEDAYMFINKHEQALEAGFLLFYPQLIKHAKQHGALLSDTRPTL